MVCICTGGYSRKRCAKEKRTGIGAFSAAPACDGRRTRGACPFSPTRKENFPDRCSTPREIPYFMKWPGGVNRCSPAITSAIRTTRAGRQRQIRSAAIFPPETPVHSWQDVRARFFPIEGVSSEVYAERRRRRNAIWAAPASARRRKNRISFPRVPTTEPPAMNNMKVFSGRAHPIWQSGCAIISASPWTPVDQQFPRRGDLLCKVEEDVRGRDVFLVQPTCAPVNENMMELLIIIDSLKRASAERITAVIPVFRLCPPRSQG